MREIRGSLRKTKEKCPGGQRLSREVAAGDPVVDQTPIADCRSRAFCIEVWVLMMAETLNRLGELSSFAALRSGDVWAKEEV